jgi:hypothetical protein
MFRWFGFVAGAATLLVAGAASAASLEPLQGASVTLGTVTGVVYYTVEADGFRVVATVTTGDGQTPLRFVATLAPDQSITLSAPRGVGQPAIELQLVRHGDRLVVDDNALLADLTSVPDTAAGP